METTLAIYEALIQANVPAPAARRVAESLEKVMTSNLATKQDLQNFESRISLMMGNQESRIVLKLGALMTVLFGLASAVLAILR